jgi:hypothetical protein
MNIFEKNTPEGEPSKGDSPEKTPLETPDRVLEIISPIIPEIINGRYLTYKIKIIISQLEKIQREILTKWQSITSVSQYNISKLSVFKRKLKQLIFNLKLLLKKEAKDKKVCFDILLEIKDDLYNEIQLLKSIFFSRKKSDSKFKGTERNKKGKTKKDLIKHALE